MCPTLKAHDVDIEQVKEDKYVGDVINNDGKIKTNIKEGILKLKEYQPK